MKVDFALDKWRGLTYPTKNHVRISQIALSLMNNIGILPYYVYKTAQHRDCYNVFGNNVCVSEVKEYNGNLNMNYLSNALVSSVIADIYDKGIIDRRKNHANLFGEGDYVDNFMRNHEKIMEYKEGDYDRYKLMLMIAYNVHYLQDAVSPMHTHLIQVNHFAVEHYIDNANIWREYILPRVSLLLNFKGISMIDNIDNLIRHVNGCAIEGLRYLKGLYKFSEGIRKEDFYRWIGYYAYRSIEATISYYFITLY